MISTALRKQVIAEANGCCEYCRNQQRFSTGQFSIEHILPLAKGGMDSRENLAFSCPACNAHKYTQTHGLDNVTRQMAPVFNPRMQVWEGHFTWSDDFTQIIALSPSGRVTIIALKMNRVESMNLRKVLYAFGEHPPGAADFSPPQ